MYRVVRKETGLGIMLGMADDTISFNVPFVTGQETPYILDAIARGHLSGDGHYTAACHQWLRQNLPVTGALLTHSGTAALEMAALLLDAQPGDEVILPSYTFVSTANAFVLRGLKPVFVDIRPDTLNLDERRLEAAITPRTRAIVVVHYAGVACEMDDINRLARHHRLAVIEDAAQGIHACYRGKSLGTLSDFGALSFHETKNIHCGEGGALLIPDAAQLERAEIIRQKGTNRAKFLRGQVDKYTWVEVGSSFLPSEINAAFLLAQLESARAITAARIGIWRRYHQAFTEGEAREWFRRPIIPEHCTHNGHLYFLLLPRASDRKAFIAALGRRGVHAVFHYVPLHNSPAGRRFASPTSLPQTEDLSERLVRLPLWPGMRDEQVARVIEAVEEVARGKRRARPAAIHQKIQNRNVGGKGRE